jgi:hypothetical protein
MCRSMSSCLYELTKERRRTTGVGQHQMWAGQYYNFHCRAPSSRRRVWAMGLISGSHGCEDSAWRKEIDIDGDGSFLMNIQELATGASGIAVSDYPEQPAYPAWSTVGGSLTAEIAGYLSRGSQRPQAHLPRLCRYVQGARCSLRASPTQKRCRGSN